MFARQSRNGKKSRAKSSGVGKESSKVQNRNGKAIGKSIKNQLNALQFSIGCAPFWKALTMMIAIDSIAPVQDMHPSFIVGILMIGLFSMKDIVYKM